MHSIVRVSRARAGPHLPPRAKNSRLPGTDSRTAHVTSLRSSGRSVGGTMRNLLPPPASLSRSIRPPLVSTADLAFPGAPGRPSFPLRLPKCAWFGLVRRLPPARQHRHRTISERLVRITGVARVRRPARCAPRQPGATSRPCGTSDPFAGDDTRESDRYFEPGTRSSAQRPHASSSGDTAWSAPNRRS